MPPTAGRDNRDAQVPPGAGAGNGTSPPCITAGYHIGVILAPITDHFILFSALKHVNTYKCREIGFKIKSESV